MAEPQASESDDTTPEGATAVIAREVRDYRQDENVPVGTFAALTAGYLAAVGATTIAFRRSGRSLPTQVPPGDIVLLGVATAKLARLVSRDRVTGWARAPFVRYKGPASESEVEEEPRGTGVRRGIGELLACPWCVGQWVIALVGAAYAFAPVPTRYLASMLTGLTIADAVQFGVNFAQEHAGE